MSRPAEIHFEEIFEPTLKAKIEHFLEQGGTAATLTKALLVTAAIGGVLTVGVAAPGLFRIFGGSDFYNKRGKRLSSEGFYRLRRSFYYLHKQKLIEGVQTQKGIVYRLTKKGKRLLRGYIEDEECFSVPRRWDKKWRAIFFDIPQTMHYARNCFRERLKKYNCFQMQKSVWIYPFACVDDVYAIAREFGVEKFVEVYTIEDFDNPRALNHFRSVLEQFL